MRVFNVVCVSLVAWSILGVPQLQADSLTPQLETLRKVEREAKGNREATKAWRELTDRATAYQLPEILAAIDGAGPLAANWLRSAVDAVAERELKQNGTFHVDALLTFLEAKQHDPRARRLAFEWIVRADPSARDRLISRFLDDPSLELRRDAVAQVLSKADTALKDKQDEDALATYRQALASARDLDQVKAATEALKKLGHPVDLAQHFGFLLDWKLVGPFDNHAGKGFGVAYPPEEGIDLAASYPGTVETVHWIVHHTDDENGQVDLNKALGKHMGAAAYAMVEFQSVAERRCELRLGTESANRIWLNGKLLSYAEVYHANGTMDQYVGRGELRSGRNVILLKICQNEQKEEWAQDWKFQLRVCDSSGKAILSTDRPPTHVARQPDVARDAKE